MSTIHQKTIKSFGWIATVKTEKTYRADGVETWRKEEWTETIPHGPGAGEVA